MFRSSISQYISSFARMACAASSDASLITAVSRLAKAMSETVSKGGTVFFAGNGGFAALSQHAASELVGRMRRNRRPAAAVSLAADSAVLTCIANDFGFRKVFARQLQAVGKLHDMVVAMSASGNSANILELLDSAGELGIGAFMITGSSCENADLLPGIEVIRMPAEGAAEVQDMASVLIHAACECVERDLQAESRSEAWRRALALPESVKNLLLDRDGVINRLLPDAYVCKPQELDLAPDFLRNAPELAARFDKILIVTNQRGVSKGLMTSADLEDIEEKLQDAVNHAGGRIDGCFLATGENPEDVKPSTGLWHRIRKIYPEMLAEESVMIGDSASDRLFASKAGIKFINIPTLC